MQSLALWVTSCWGWGRWRWIWNPRYKWWWEKGRKQEMGWGVTSVVLLNLKGWTPPGRGLQKTPGISRLYRQQWTEMRGCPSTRGCWNGGCDPARSRSARGQVVPVRANCCCSRETTLCVTSNRRHVRAPCLSVQILHSCAFHRIHASPVTVEGTQKQVGRHTSPTTDLGQGTELAWPRSLIWAGANGSSCLRVLLKYSSFWHSIC